jgi:hypothetical protein
MWFCRIMRHRSSFSSVCCPSVCILRLKILCYSSALVSSIFFHQSKNVIVLKQIVFYLHLMEIRFSGRSRCQPRVYSVQSIGLTSACQYVYKCPRWDPTTTVIKTGLCLHFSVLMMTALSLCSTVDSESNRDLLR